MKQESKDINQNVSALGDLTENELLDELVALAMPARKPGGVTVKEMMAEGLSEATTRGILRKKEREGMLYAVMCLDNGHPVKVWYKKQS